jgi:hypothetical protein
MQTWKRTILEEAGKCGKTCSTVKRFAGNRVRWRCFTMPYVPNGMKGYTTTTVREEYEVFLAKKCFKIMVHGKGGQLDRLQELHFRRQLRQEPFINKIKYLFLFF